jgi:hypothetical protein
LARAVLAVPGTIVHAWLGHIDWSATLAYGVGIALLSGGLLAFAR